MNLLINEPPLQVLPTLAVKIGLNNAIVLQQVHYWLCISNNIRDGYKWVYRTMDEWNAEFPFWSKSTVERAIKELEKSKILVTANYNRLKMDRTKWYRIDYEMLQKIWNETIPQNEGKEPIEMTESKPLTCCNEMPQNDGNDSINSMVPITRQYKEKSTENTTEKKSRSKPIYDHCSVYYQLANLLYEKILQDDPSFKKPNLQNWADHIRLMMEKDGRTAEQIEYLIEWSQNHSFWKSNILSTKKLREKATTLIRQMRVEKETKVQKNYNHRRTEIVPDWFYKRYSSRKVPVESNEIIDYEAERRRILEKLGHI